MEKEFFDAALETLTSELEKAKDENIKIRLQEAIDELTKKQEESIDTE